MSNLTRCDHCRQLISHLHIGWFRGEHICELCWDKLDADTDPGADHHDVIGGIYFMSNPEHVRKIQAELRAHGAGEFVRKRLEHFDPAPVLEDCTRYADCPACQNGNGAKFCDPCAIQHLDTPERRARRDGNA